MKKFKIGQTYTTRSACDYDCVFTWTVVGRTEKSIKIVGDCLSKPTSRKIRIYGDYESVMPLGSFSMAPVISA
jgi:hypothetical protein